MNSVNLIGRITRDPEVRYNHDIAVCSMTVAIDRPTKAGAEKQTDFPRVVCFGKTAENCGKFLSKGRLIAVSGSIQTGSYEKDGVKIYTTDVIANRVEFLERAQSENGDAASKQQEQKPKQQPKQEEFENFAALDEEVPF